MLVVLPDFLSFPQDDFPGIDIGDFLAVCLFFLVVTEDEVAGENLAQRRFLFRIIVSEIRAINDSLAALLGQRIRLGNRRKEGFGIGMKRVAEELVARGEFDEIPEIHDGDAIAEILDGREVVAMKIIVKPISSFNSFSKLMICARMETSNAEIGSSQMRSFGFMIKARAMPIL